jgi:hypothetical protein
VEIGEAVSGYASKVVDVAPNGKPRPGTVHTNGWCAKCWDDA